MASTSFKTNPVTSPTPIVGAMGIAREAAEVPGEVILAVRSWTSMVLAGTHRCQAADADIGMAEVVFDVRSDALATLPATIDDCTVTLDPPGTVGDAIASGTFSAMGHTDTGISLSVSAGIFATPTEY